MATSAPASRRALGPGVVALLAVMVFINYVDRGNLATAAPLIKDELGLSAARAGVLLSAFFWTYTPCQLLAGWLAERWGPRATLAAGLAVWSASTALTGIASGFAALAALRLTLGVGESVAFPASSKLLARLPPSELGRANGLVAVGLALGPAFGTLAGGLMMARFGWRPSFLVFGLASMLWLIPWLALARRDQAEERAAAALKAPSFRELLSRRELWGTGVGHFASNYVFYFVVTWLPLYLVKARGLSVAEMARLGGLVYLAYAVSGFLTGALSDHAIARGAPVSGLRRSVAVASQLVSATGMALAAAGGPSLAIAGLFVAAVGFGLNTPTLYAIGQTLAGPRAGGKWMGLQNGMGNCAGILAPLVTGEIVQQTGAFEGAFLAAGLVALVGVAGFGLVLPKIAPVAWPEAPLPSVAGV